jgi:hypothetical protein
MFLTHELIEAPWPHPHRQRSIGSWHLNLGGFTRIEQPVSHYGPV